ncbi:DUF421 domain-containing protein [Fictibacillus sp. Mic-4]|uniref:YetF domain-containing protein n=1 Tax=Fictibacillus TaxID=1329200 RepID=UPI0004037001|nr:DUF421 domain-containing protein [Fictibacillus gelatini]
MNDHWIMVIRTIIGFSVLLVLTRVLGKKQLGELTYFNYVTGIATGGIIGDMIIHRDIKILDGIITMFVWGLLIFIIEFATRKPSKAKVVLKSEPTILIKKGEIIQEALKKLSLGMDDLSMMLRIKDVFSIMEVDYAIMEPNGELSIKKKREKESLCREDMNISKIEPKYLPSQVIVEGIVMKRNLKEYGLTENWLTKQLDKAGISSIDEVYFAQLQEDGSLFIAKKAAQN